MHDYSDKTPCLPARRFFVQLIIWMPSKAPAMGVLIIHSINKSIFIRHIKPSVFKRICMIGVYLIYNLSWPIDLFIN